ncbi:MAG: hypothetical protein JXA20_14270 [Spirochaetes bacterium]|nr:hypothetical protein [Spirochaetota bacterium]
MVRADEPAENHECETGGIIMRVYAAAVSFLILLSFSSCGPDERDINGILSGAGIEGGRVFLTVARGPVCKNINSRSGEFVRLLRSSVRAGRAVDFHGEYTIWAAGGSAFRSQVITVDVGRESIHILKHRGKQYYIENAGLLSFCRDAFDESGIIVK